MRRLFLDFRSKEQQSVSKYFLQTVVKINTGAVIRIPIFEETVFEDAELHKLLLGVVGSLPKEPDDSRYGVSVCKNIFKRSILCEKNIRFISERKS